MSNRFNYMAYDLPKRGVFSIEKEPAEYKLPDGWVRVEVEYDIIGEDDDTYVRRISDSTTGIHKTRLVRWVSAQLSLF